MLIQLQLVERSIESVESVGKTKQRNLEQITMIMQHKIQLIQQYGGPQAKQ
jgi:hypothetical protein